LEVLLDSIVVSNQQTGQQVVSLTILTLLIELFQLTQRNKHETDIKSQSRKSSADTRQENLDILKPPIENPQQSKIIHQMDAVGGQLVEKFYNLTSMFRFFDVRMVGSVTWPEFAFGLD
jgi:hypothetical protein